MDELDGHLLAKIRALAFRQIDRAHAAPAELAQHAVRTEALRRRGQACKWRALESVSRRGMGVEQGGNLGVERRVPCTG